VFALVGTAALVGEGIHRGTRPAGIVVALALVACLPLAWSSRAPLAALLGATLGLLACLAAFRPYDTAIFVLALALGVVGVTSVVAQILVPFASALASEDERGRVVGQVMSGLLMGILLARTVSGLVAALAGWRAVFAFADAQKRRIYFIYNYKRGFWYPFVPDSSGPQQRSTERELQIKAQMGSELPMEPELERWFPLWGIPI